MYGMAAVVSLPRYCTGCGKVCPVDDVEAIKAGWRHGVGKDASILLCRECVAALMEVESALHARGGSDDVHPR